MVWGCRLATRLSTDVCGEGSGERSSVRAYLCHNSHLSNTSRSNSPYEVSRQRVFSRSWKCRLSTRNANRVRVRPISREHRDRHRQQEGHSGKSNYSLYDGPPGLFQRPTRLRPLSSPRQLYYRRKGKTLSTTLRLSTRSLLSLSQREKCRTKSRGSPSNYELYRVQRFHVCLPKEGPGWGY